MNPELYTQPEDAETYKQVHRTTEAIGIKDTPTPIKVHVSKNDDGNYYLTVEGTDGQQVSDLTVNALRQVSGNQKPIANGFREWAFGLFFCSIVSVAIVNSLAPLINPQANSQPIQTQAK